MLYPLFTHYADIAPNAPRSLLLRPSFGPLTVRISPSRRLAGYLRAAIDSYLAELWFLMIRSAFDGSVLISQSAAATKPRS